MVRHCSVFALVTALALSVFGQSPDLEDYVGKDLRHLPKNDFQTLLSLLGRSDNDFPFRNFCPWHVWRTDQVMPQRFIVFEGRLSWETPGESMARISLFDESDKKLNEWTFSTGWRLKLVDASLAYRDELCSCAITIETSAENLGRDVAKQYFAIVDDQLHLVRLEDSEGRPIANDYEHPNHTLGLKPLATKSVDWTNALKSQQTSKVLAALMFLGGKHFDPHRGSPGELIEDLAQAELVEFLRNDERIISLVKQRLDADNRWVKEAAEMAMNTMVAK